MTWDELLEKTRKALSESNAYLQEMENMVTAAGKDDGDLNGHQVGAMLVLLILAVSNIHSAVEHMSIGLDAVVEAMREASETQEVKGG